MADHPRAHTYTASTTLYVASAAIDSAQVSDDSVAGFDRVIKTFTATLPTPRVVQAGIEEAGVDRSAAATRVRPEHDQVENTNLIHLSVTDEDPAVVRALANGILSPAHAD